MARRKAEIDLLGVASKEELMKFEVGKELDKSLAESVSKINNNSSNRNVVTEEELLRIKKKGEQEILDIQNELKEFKISEERKISFLPIEEEEEEEIYIPSRLEKIAGLFKLPFIKLVDKYDGLTLGEKFEYFKSIVLVMLVLITMSLSVFAAKKYKIETASYIDLKLVDVTAGQIAVPQKEIKIKDDKFILSRVLIDGQNTLFIFEGPVDFSAKYSATIEDNELSKYYMDQHYMRNLKFSNEGKVLAMEPLNDGIKEFDLIVKENETGDEFSYHFRLSEFLDKSDYVRVYNMDNINDESLNLNSFIASAAGSVLNYSLVYDGKDYCYKVIDSVGTYSDIFENMTIIPSKQNKIEQFDFPEQGITLLQESFSTPQDLSAKINFSANNIFKTYHVNKVIPRTVAQEGVKYDYGQYSLYIEGLQKRGDMAVLVYHTEDNSFVPPVVETPDKKKKTTKKEETPKVENFEVTEKSLNTTNRVFTLLDVEIVIFNSKGEIIDTIVPSKINAKDEGADVIFKDDRLSKVAYNFGIRINEVGIRDTEYAGIIDLSEAYIDSPSQVEYQTDIINIEKAFESRLAFKAAETPRSQIVNFSSDVIANRDLMSRYVPMSLKSPATYSAEVITTALKDNQIYAIVEEDFMAQTFNTFVHVNTQHRVIYDTEIDKIILDEVIKSDILE